MKPATQQIGPWKRADIRSLAELCKEGCRDAGPSRLRGGLMSLAAPSRDLGEVHRAMRAHPIYKWLAHHVRRLQALANDDELREIQLVHLLLQYMTITYAIAGDQPTTTRRRDKKRRAAANRISRVERDLDDGMVSLTQPQLDMLRLLLTEANSELTGASRSSTIKHPALEGLAYALYRDLGISDTRLLFEVAAASELDCDERLVQRYIKRAKKPD